MTVPTALIDAHDAAVEAAFTEDDPTTRYNAVAEVIGWHERQKAALLVRLHAPAQDPEPTDDEG